MSYIPHIPNDVIEENRLLPFDHGSVSVTTPLSMMRMKRHRFRVDSAQYINPTGFTADPANYWTIAVQNGGTVVASWSTLTGAQGTLPANAFVELVLSATDGNHVLQAEDVLSIVLTRVGAPGALPAGRVIVHGRYV